MVRGVCTSAGGPDGGPHEGARFVLTGDSAGERISFDGMWVARHGSQERTNGSCKVVLHDSFEAALSEPFRRGGTRTSVYYGGCHASVVALAASSGWPPLGVDYSSNLPDAFPDQTFSSDTKAPLHPHNF